MKEKIRKTIVIKIGTSSLTGPNSSEAINREVLRSLAKVSSELMSRDYRVVIVSSGAMGLGIAKLGISEIRESGPDLLTFKQALTSVGQVQLMNAYQAAFDTYALQAGQVLLTHRGLLDPERSHTIKRTISKLFELNIVPIVNENDTVTAAEIEFGDNDTLSAELAVLLSADVLYILTDTDGLYEADPHQNPEAKLITRVTKIDDRIRNIAGVSHSSTATGGMRSKIMAAEICMNSGLEMEILNINQIEKISQLPEGLGTRFSSKSV